MSTNKSSVRRSLIVSATALVLTVAMLIGTTFAWFTDSVSSGKNKINTGNLKVKFEYSTDMVNWKEVKSDTKIYDDSMLLEPGVTNVVYLRAVNAGSLAVKYNMKFSTVKSSRGKNINDGWYYVTDYLKAGAVQIQNNTKFSSREEAQNAISSTVDAIDSFTGKPFFTGTLSQGVTSDPVALVFYMPTTVGNEANPKYISDNYWSSKLSLGLALQASQTPEEKDSFDESYDTAAPNELSAWSTSAGHIDVTENTQANGGGGVVKTTRSSSATINADIYAVYAPNGNVSAAMAVWAQNSSYVKIEGGTFTQVGVPENDPCDLIYAMDSATIEITGGTFKATQPERTLNCLDGSSAKITVSGGSFYKYDPSHPTLGDNEVTVADGYHVEQDGDWYNVVAD